MVLLDLQIKPVATKIFEADIWTIDGTRKTLKSKYQPVLNIKHIRQGCRIIEFKHKHGNTSKNSSSNNLVSYLNSNKKNKNLNNYSVNKSEKNSQEKNANEINSNTINNFVSGIISNFNANYSPDNGEIKITNIHPLRNLPNKSELKVSFDASLNPKNDTDINNKLEHENEIKKATLNTYNKSIDNINKELNEIEIPENPQANKNKEKQRNNFNLIENKNINNYDNDNNSINKMLKKNPAYNGPKKAVYNSDNANKIINLKENTKANKAAKHKKSSISKKEEILIKIKPDFNSEKNIIKLNELNGEYENLKLKENEDNEETCVISPHNNCTVIFEFMYNPEYITEDANILISDQLIKAHGIVRKLLV